MIKIEGGTYLIGTNTTEGFLEDNEGPTTLVTIGAYYIDETAVTNTEFKEFVDETGYVTDAERYGWSYVFHYFISDEEKRKSQKIYGLKWWYAVRGAYWCSPEGFSSTIKERMDHPVTHVSRNDAVSYAKWAEKRLPTEAEWEIAARGGTVFDNYYWGEELLVNGKHQCNIWQGNFPVENDLADGFSSTAPVRSYPPNQLGIYEMLGNVWEWCSNPRGVPLLVFNQVSAKELWSKNQEINDLQYAIKGGSFLCHDSYCKRYRLSARNGNSASSTSNNMGFRCVKDTV